MKTPWKYAAVAFLIAGSSALAYQQGAARSSFNDEVHGFTIETPRYPGSSPNQAGSILVVPGPSTNGFASNLNILIQPPATSVKNYIELSVAGFKQVGLKVNAQRELKVSGRDAVEFDYEGELKKGQKLRFLSLAVIEKGRVLLATATAPADGFAEVEAELRASLASLKLK